MSPFFKELFNFQTVKLCPNFISISQASFILEIFNVPIFGRGPFPLLGKIGE